MVQCKKCKQYVPKTKGDIIQCRGNCGATYHKTCIADTKIGICDGCSPGKSLNISPIIKQNPKDMTVESLLMEMNNKMEIIYTIKKQMDEMSSSIEFYAEKYQELVEFKNQAIDNLQKNDKKIIDLQNKNKYLEKYNRALVERIGVLENSELKLNIELVGMQKQEDENILENVNKFAEILNVNKNEIQNVWRVGRENKNSRPRPVIVTLRTRSARDAWLRGRKQRIINGQIFKNNNESPIYINENVTKQVRDVFWQAKNILKDKAKYIWIQGGKVLVRRTEDEKICHIRAIFTSLI